MKFYVYTDGAARGNPGGVLPGLVVLDVKRRVVLKKSFYNGIKTNNVAEYLAIIAALKILIEQYGSGDQIELFSDSELVVNQLNHNYKVKDKRLKELNKEATGIWQTSFWLALSETCRGRTRHILKLMGD